MVADATNKRWKVLPPEGQGECDWNPELEPAHPGEKPRETRRNIATYQTSEAIRLATDYALLQRGTHRSEIGNQRMAEVRAVIRAWNDVLNKLRQIEVFGEVLPGKKK